MQSSSSSRLDVCAAKCLISDLFSESNEFASNLVWLQGEIDNVSQSSTGELILRDDTGKVKVTNINNNPDGKEWMKPGVYCMVMGERMTVTSSASTSIQIRALKMTDLTSRPLHKKIWAKEVFHQQNRTKENQHKSDLAV